MLYGKRLAFFNIFYIDEWLCLEKQNFLEFSLLNTYLVFLLSFLAASMHLYAGPWAFLYLKLYLKFTQILNNTSSLVTLAVLWCISMTLGTAHAPMTDVISNLIELKSLGTD
jgi:hypothetical protein